jgi:hypothetical protein
MTTADAPARDIQDWGPLETALIWIIENPQSYDQSVWLTDCGTVRCVAGWVADAAGFVYETHSSLLQKYGRSWVVSNAARHALLGDAETQRQCDLPAFDEDIDDVLFSGGLSWAEVICNVMRIAEADGHTLDPRIPAQINGYHGCGLDDGVLHGGRNTPDGFDTSDFDFDDLANGQ